MSRRSLKKVDPAVDLSEHLLTDEELPRPWSGTELFGREAPLEVEIGSGKGLFLRQASQLRPEHDFLGVEIADRYARFIAARLARAGIGNARIVHGDGLRVMEGLPEKALAAVHVYFPDPWWKARHRKRRVMNARFLADVERALVPGGRLHFWTDVEEYYQTALAEIGTNTKLAGPFAVAEKTAEHDLDFRTHFERRMRMHGEAVYRAEFEKTRETTALSA
jgi:tRNA (guanine-N7-)-methyltransferase